jgi:pilus assembly protein CpaE
MAILYVADRATSDSFAFAVGTDALVVDSLPALMRAADEHPEEVLVVVGPDVDLASALQFTEANRVHRPHLGVVLARRRVDVTMLAQALRAGVREVVNPDDLRAVSDACRRSVEVSNGILGASAEGPVFEGKVITVFSAKGGCGKTTVATNLAVSLAAGGAHTVCVVDLDLAFGDVGIALQLMPQRTVGDAAAMAGSMDVTGAQSLLTAHSPGLWAVLAPVNPGDAEKIPATVVAELIRTLKRMFEYVVIDTPPAFTEHVLTALDNTDVQVLLATLDIPAVKNLRLALDTLDALGYPRQGWRIVLNRSDAKVDLTVADVARTLGTTISAQIPSSRAVPASVNRGVPIVLDEPNHPVSVAIRTLADDIVRDLFPAPAGGQHAASADGRTAPRSHASRHFAFVRRGATT